MFKKILDWRTKPVDELTEAELIKRAYKTVSDLKQLIDDLKEFQKEFTGTEHNPEGGFFHEMRSFKKNTEDEIVNIKREINDIKLKHNSIFTGISIGKWAVGGSLIAFFASNLGDFAHWLKKVFS